MGQKTHVTHTAPGHKLKQISQTKPPTKTQVIHPSRTTKNPKKWLGRVPNRKNNKTNPKKKKKKSKAHRTHNTTTQTTHNPTPKNTKNNTPQKTKKKKKKKKKPYSQWHTNTTTQPQ